MRSRWGLIVLGGLVYLYWALTTVVVGRFARDRSTRRCVRISVVVLGEVTVLVVAFAVMFAVADSSRAVQSFLGSPAFLGLLFLQAAVITVFAVEYGAAVSYGFWLLVLRKEQPPSERLRQAAKLRLSKLLARSWQEAVQVAGLPPRERVRAVLRTLWQVLLGLSIATAVLAARPAAEWVRGGTPRWGLLEYYALGVVGGACCLLLAEGALRVARWLRK